MRGQLTNKPHVGLYLKSVPKFRTGINRWIIIHHALDGRRFEWVKTIQRHSNNIKLLDTDSSPDVLLSSQ